MNEKSIRIQMKADSKTAYIALPGHPAKPVAGVVSKTICLHEIIDKYEGPMVNLDFNKNGKLIGIEILVPRGDEESN